MIQPVKKFAKFSMYQSSHHDILTKKGKVSKRTENWQDFNTSSVEKIDKTIVEKQIKNEQSFDLPVRTDQDVLHHVEKLRTENKRNYIVNNFYDSKLIDAIRCILFEVAESSEDLHDVFLGAKKIGAHSASGSAVYSKRGDVIFKIPNSVGSEEMRHEFVIGVILSRLRDNCVNFSAVYDVLTEGMPIISQSGQVVQACNEGEIKTTIAVYEYVNGAVALTDLDEKQFLSCFIQAILALHYAYSELEFTHYDAHDENILAYSFSNEEFYIKYKYVDEEIYVKSFGKVAMFIDYGKSYLKYDGKKYGVMDYANFHLTMGIYPDMANPCSDQFKLVCMLIRKFRMNQNERLVNLCLKIAGYFFNKDSLTMEDFNLIHASTWNERYHARPETVLYMNWSAEDFIDHCIEIGEEYGLISTSEPEKVLGKNMRSSLNYDDPSSYEYGFEEFDLKMTDKYRNSKYRNEAIDDIERNIDQLARFVSTVINAKEENLPEYQELKNKADRNKSKMRQALEKLKTLLYGVNPTEDKIMEIDYGRDTENFANVVKKAESVVGSLLEL